MHDTVMIFDWLDRKDQFGAKFCHRCTCMTEVKEYCTHLRIELFLRMVTFMNIQVKLFGHLADLLSSKANWHDILAMIQAVGLTSQFRFPQESLLVEMYNCSIRYQLLFFFLVNVAGIK